MKSSIGPVGMLSEIVGIELLKSCKISCHKYIIISLIKFSKNISIQFGVILIDIEDGFEDGLRFHGRVNS